MQDVLDADSTNLPREDRVALWTRALAIGEEVVRVDRCSGAREVYRDALEMLHVLKSSDPVDVEILRRKDEIASLKKAFWKEKRDFYAQQEERKARFVLVRDRFEAGCREHKIALDAFVREKKRGGMA